MFSSELQFISTTVKLFTSNDLQYTVCISDFPLQSIVHVGTIIYEQIYLIHAFVLQLSRVITLLLMSYMYVLHFAFHQH